jgi:hypothetical protein
LGIKNDCGQFVGQGKYTQGGRCLRKIRYLRIFQLPGWSVLVGAALRKFLAGWLRRLSVFLFFVAAEDRIKNF